MTAIVSSTFARRSLGASGNSKGSRCSLNDGFPAGDSAHRAFHHWQQADRLAAENRSKNLALAQEALKAEYEEHGRQAIDRFIAEELPPGEFERRVAAYMAEPSNQS